MIVGAYGNTPVQGEEMSENERYYLVCPLRKNVGTRIPVTLCHRDKCFFLISKDGKLACDYNVMKVKKAKGIGQKYGNKRRSHDGE